MGVVGARCRMCRRGYNNMCPDYEAFGISIDGGFQEFMLRLFPAATILSQPA